MKARSLQHIARMVEQSGGSYADYSPRTDFGDLVIIRHKDIVKTRVKELDTAGVLDDGIS